MLLDSFKEDELISPSLMEHIIEVLNEFWHWVANNLTYEEWKSSSEVNQWLAVQKPLIKSGLLRTDAHHPILYAQLKCHYESFPSNGLHLYEIIPLLVCSCRMIGYAQEIDEEVDMYPLSQITKKIIGKKPQEYAKLKNIIFTLRAIFYLIHQYCSFDQLELLPYLIYFRSPSTHEERRSELQTFYLLSQKASCCLDFFLAYNDYIDLRSINEIVPLSKVKHLLPSERTQLINPNQGTCFIYKFIQSSRMSPQMQDQDLLRMTFTLITTEFSQQKDTSYNAALMYISTIKNQTSRLQRHEIHTVHRAAYLFSLSQYTKHLNEDPLLTYSLFSISKETKASAAKKKQLAIQGFSVNYSFLENLALNEGRLKQLVDSFENNKLEHVTKKYAIQDREKKYPGL